MSIFQWVHKGTFGGSASQGFIFPDLHPLTASECALFLELQRSTAGNKTFSANGKTIFRNGLMCR